MKCTLGHRGRGAALRYARAGRCGALWPVLCFALLLGFLYPVAPAVGQGKIMQAKVQIVAPDPANPSQTVTIYDDGGVDDYTAPDVTSVFPLYLVVRLDKKEPILNDGSPAAFPKPESGPCYNISIGNPGMLASGGGTFYGDRRRVQSHPELLTNYKFARWSYYSYKITGQAYGGRKIYAFTYPALYPGMVLSIKDNSNPLTRLLDAHETGSSYLYEGTDPNSHVKRMAHVVKGEYRLLAAMGGQVKKDWTSFFEWNNSYGYCTAVLPESSSWDFRSNNVPLFASRKLLSHQAGVCSFDFAGITGDVILELRFTLGDRPEQRVDFLSNGAVNSRVLLFTPEVNFDVQTNINFPSKGTKYAEVPVWFPILNKSGDLVVAKEATGYHFLLGTYLAIEKPAGVPAEWGVFAGGWPEAGGSGGKPIGKELTIGRVNYIVFPVEHRDKTWQIAVGLPPKLCKVTFGSGITVTPSGGSPIISGESVAENTELIVKVTPPACEQVGEVRAGPQVLSASADGTYHHVVTADVEITATFSPIQITLSPLTHTGYTVAYDKSTVDCGGSVQVTIKPANPLAVAKQVTVTFAAKSPGESPRVYTPVPDGKPGARTFTLDNVETPIQAVEAQFEGPYTLEFVDVQSGFKLSLEEPPIDRFKELSPSGSTSKKYEVAARTALTLRVAEQERCLVVDKVQYMVGGGTHDLAPQHVPNFAGCLVQLPALTENVTAVTVTGRAREMTVPTTATGAKSVSYSPANPTCGADLVVTLVPGLHKGLENVVVTFQAIDGLGTPSEESFTSTTGLTKGTDGNYSLTLKNLQAPVATIVATAYTWPKLTVKRVPGYTLEVTVNGAPLPADGYVDRGARIGITVTKDAGNACYDEAQWVSIGNTPFPLTSGKYSYSASLDAEISLKPVVKQYKVDYDEATVTVLANGVTNVPKGGLVDCGTQLQFVPKIADACQEFESFSIVGGATATVADKSTVGGKEGYWYELKSAITIGLKTKTKQLVVSWSDAHVKEVKSGSNSPLASGAGLACGSPLTVAIAGEPEREIQGLVVTYGDGTMEPVGADKLNLGPGGSTGSYTITDLQKSISSIEVTLAAPPMRYNVKYSAPSAAEATVSVKYGPVGTTPAGDVVAGGTQLREGANITITATPANPKKHRVEVKLTMGGSTALLQPAADGSYGFKLTGEATITVGLVLQQYKVEYVAKDSNRELTVRAGSSGGNIVGPGSKVAYGTKLYVLVKALVGEVNKVTYSVEGSATVKDAVLEGGVYTLEVEENITSIDCQVGSCTQYTLLLQRDAQGELKPGRLGKVATATLLKSDGTPVDGMGELTKDGEVWKSKSGLLPSTQIGVKLEGLPVGWHAVGLTANDILVSTKPEYYYFTLPGAVPRNGCEVEVKALVARDVQPRPEEACYLWVLADAPEGGEVSVVFEGATLVPYGGFAPVLRGRRVQVVAQPHLGYEVLEASIGGEAVPELTLSSTYDYIVPVDPQVKVVQVRVRFTPAPLRYNVSVNTGMHATYTVADPDMERRIKSGKPVLSGELLDLTINAKEGFYLKEVLCNDTAVYTPTEPQSKETRCQYKVAVTRPLQIVVRTGQLSVLPVEEAFVSGIKAYPNPTTGQLTLEGVRQVESYRLLDLRGQLLRTHRFGVLQPQQLLELGGLPDGFYLLLLRTTGGVEVPLRIAVQRP